MDVVQISAVANSAWTNVIGSYDADGKPENIVIAEDLSNIVDFGKALTSTNYSTNHYYKQIVDKIGLSILYNDEFDKGDELELTKTSTEAGSIVEMLYFTDGEFQDNESWDDIVGGVETAAPDFDDMFGYHPVPVTAEYFNRKLTLESEPYTVTELQWKSAFNSPADFVKFVNGIEQRWKNKFSVLNAKLKKMLLASWMAEKFLHNYNGCINLLAEYKERFSSASETAADCLYSPDFLRFAYARMNIYCEALRDRGSFFNTEKFVTSTPLNRQKRYVFAPFIQYANTYLFANTYNKDDSALKYNFNQVNSWQSNGDHSDESVKMEINLKSPSSPLTANKFGGILGCIFDERALFIVDEFPRIVAQNNNFAEWTNYKHKLDISLYSTTRLPGLVFYVDDYAYSAYATGGTSAPSDWAALITAGIYTRSNDGTYTAVAEDAAWSSTTVYYTKIA